MKARKGPPKDYQEIRAKVEQASKLMAGGLSESRAAKTVGLPRSSLQHYLKHGIPKPGLPKPEACRMTWQVKSRMHQSCLPKAPCRSSGTIMDGSWQATPSALL